MTQKLSARTLLLLVYIASLLYSVSYALPLYVNSTFLAGFVPGEQAVGLVFAGGALLSTLCILTLPKILNRFGNYRTTLSVAFLEALVMVILALAKDPILVIGAFVLNQVLLNIIYLNLNTLLEAFSQESSAGGVHGIFLTIVNAAILVAPLLGGLLLTDGAYEKIYLAAACFMILVFVVLGLNFRDYRDPKYKTPTFKETFAIVSKSHDLHAIIIVQFLLNFFYAWMIIYTPLYLHNIMGIPMNEILGVITPIALIPFVVFQIILGKIADNKLGEKEILVASFIIMALSTISLSFIESSSVLVWAALLFITRVGASAVEVMSESYFYKQVTPSDVHLITFTYVIRSSAYLVGPLLGSLFLLAIDYRMIFFVLGTIMILGIPYSLHFKDSR